MEQLPPTKTSTKTADTVTLRQGDDRLSVGYYFQGAIDELSFYDRALDRQEIDQIYRAGSFGKCLPAG